MRILLWHGYLLGGTGSNIYTPQLAPELLPVICRRAAVAVWRKRDTFPRRCTRAAGAAEVEEAPLGPQRAI